MKRIVVIPAHNEEQSIAALIEAAYAHGDAHAVIVADDSSTDYTVRFAERAGATTTTVPKDRPGLAGVYRHGLMAALEIYGTGNVQYAEMDGGFSHEPRELPRLWDALDAGADVAAGCRFGGGHATYKGHWRRAVLSYVGTRVTNALHGTHFKDATSGFIGYTGGALQLLTSMPWHARGHYYQTELRLRAVALALKVVEVPITYFNSGSSLNWSSIKEAARLVTGMDHADA